MEDKQFYSKYKFRIKVELIDGVTYYTPQKAIYPVLLGEFTSTEGRKVPMRSVDGRWEPTPEEYWKTGKWQDLPITSNDAMEKNIAQEVIDHHLLMEKRDSGMFIKEYLEV